MIHFCYEKQISILEGFLKDHVTLKTGGMMLKNLYIGIFHNIAVFTVFLIEST